MVPVTVNELYQSPEDYYFPIPFGAFLRMFRILGNNIAVALPGLYIALVGVNTELLPIRFTLNVVGSRLGVAIPLLMAGTTTNRNRSGNFSRRKVSGYRLRSVKPLE